MATLTVHEHPPGSPDLSATFVLSRTPAPADRLTNLVTSATLALTAQAGSAPDAAGHAGQTVRSVRLELLGDGEEILAEQRTTDPFGLVALSVTLTGADAVAAMESVLAGAPTLRLRARVEANSVDPAPPVPPLTAHLALVWDTLSGQGLAEFRYDDLLASVPALRAAEAISGGGGEDWLVVETLLLAARWVLELTDDGGWRLAATRPPEMTVTKALPASRAGTPLRSASAIQVLTRPLTELVAEAGGPDAVAHVVVMERGQLRPLAPVRRTRGTRGTRGTLGPGLAATMKIAAFSQGDDQVSAQSITAALRPTAAARPSVSAISAVAVRPELTLAPLGLAEVTPTRRPGPDVGSGQSVEHGDWWKDRWDLGKRWYAPRHRLAMPAVVADPAQSPFRFEITSEPGHGLDGRPAIAATVTVELERGPSAEASETTDELTLVPEAETTYRLSVPFLDEEGRARQELFTADSASAIPEGVRLTFRLRDMWARLAYGALSTPGFQADPPQIVATTTFGGWRRTPQVTLTAAALAGLPKIASLAKKRSARARSRNLPAALPTLHTLAGATLRPPLQLREDMTILPVREVWEKLVTIDRLDLVVPCATYGDVYRSAVDGESTAIGCQPAMQLGQIEYKTYEPVEVAAAEGWAQVLRSLRTPGTFLIVPDRYTVGWSEPDAPRPYTPQLLVQSTIDIDNPTQMRCIVAIGLQGDVPRYVRARILAELRDLHPAPRLERPEDTHHAPDLTLVAPGSVSVDWAATSTGFDIVCETDIAGLMALKALLDRDGLRGNATWPLPGNVRARADVIVSTATIAGPYEAGPVNVRPDRGSQHITNAVAVPVAVTGLERDGTPVTAVDAVVDPGQELTVASEDSDPGLLPVYSLSSAGQPIEEVRAYIEDLELGLVFVATAKPSTAELTGLEITSRFDGRELAPVTLTDSARQAEVRLHLPLTSYVADPEISFEIHRITDEGRMTGPTQTWKVRTQGALVPVDPAQHN
ncbi:hypothetical protein IM660_16465 [Ruania alkalisoli]|uniref:Uncharacterized protein n=1 Tax=Ruania alkalisoli TaxID=2779775 RepID=A0A7M1SSR4_9MICO|nr:hypothetical protein [Ruania alkalisoli]QOR70187.1 hypothetical protein IM660_16465 [Ruania alkalisoli]